MQILYNASLNKSYGDILHSSTLLGNHLVPKNLILYSGTELLVFNKSKSDISLLFVSYKRLLTECFTFCYGTPCCLKFDFRIEVFRQLFTDVNLKCQCCFAKGSIDEDIVWCSKAKVVFIKIEYPPYMLLPFNLHFQTLLLRT